MDVYIIFIGSSTILSWDTFLILLYFAIFRICRQLKRLIVMHMCIRSLTIQITIILIKSFW